MDSTGSMLRDTASRLFQEQCDATVLRAAEQGTWPAAAWNEVAAAGLHLALVPEAAGGFGVAVSDALTLLRVAGEHALPLPLAETMLASWLLAGAGFEIPDGALTIAPVAAGERLALERTAGGWRLDGTVTRVPWGRLPGIGLVVLAEHAGAPHVVLLPTKSRRVTPDANLALEPRDTIRFEEILTDATVRPAAAGVGAPQLRALGAAMRSLQMAGALMRLSDMTTHYAQERVQFGRPIGKFQAVQHNLAILATQTAAAVAAADLAAEAVAEGMRILPIAAAKARTGEAAGICAGIAHQMHGAIGFTYEHSLHFFTKRLWSWRDEFGNETAWNLLLGLHMAKAGADDLWREITAA